ncbi:MAG: OmpA family protein [Melioribacteraceae bacterium]|nr:OmpA family protein [Melioribacteraceae bacterium]WKZ71294.1 MAG: OmpA family protein [Melioribacteraceae bacterium]
MSSLETDLYQEDNDKDRYLITYADLITLLLGLFIILYAISNIDIKKYEEMMSAIGSVFGGANVINSQPAATSAIAVEPIDKLKDELNSLITEMNYTKSISVEQNERGLTLHILDDILFPSGSAELNSGSVVVLNQLASIIKKLPNDIRVEGHTDNIPIKSSLYPSNWHLSVARALNTAYFLIDKENINPDKVSIVGYSEYQPIATNLTDEGRAKNRRVDLVIIK